MSIFDEIEQKGEIKGIAKGISKGISKGILQEKHNTIIRSWKNGITVSVISKITVLPISEIEKTIAECQNMEAV